MRTLALTLAAAFAASAAAGAQTPGPSPAPAASSAPAPADPAAVQPVVHIKDFALVPDTITISAGQSVLFVQDDATPHTVTATDRSFDSGNLDLHQTWSHGFDKPGTYTYSCTYHPAMKGTVIVK